MTQALENGQCKARRFTGAGLRGSQYVVATQDGWNTLGLDGRGFAVTLASNGLKNRRR